MKRRYQNGGEVDAMDPLEEANKLYVSELMSKPALKEMGDAGVAEETGQFGGAGSSRTVKATPKAMPKSAKKETARDTGSDMARMMNRAKSVEKPVDETKLSANERTKRNIEKNLSSARSGSGSTDRRSVTDRIKASFGMKSGGMTASKRADGIAQRGKTRGKMC
jgi:hypothetical protein